MPVTSPTLRQMIARTMRDQDRWVLVIVYRDAKGKRTRRVVSPIRYVGNDRMCALCLCRQEPRHFSIACIESAELKDASTVLMPEPIVQIEDLPLLQGDDQ